MAMSCLLPPMPIDAVASRLSDWQKRAAFRSLCASSTGAQLESRASDVHPEFSLALLVLLLALFLLDSKTLCSAIDDP